MSMKKLFLFLFLWNITLNANVQNGNFSETQGRYFTPSQWSGSGVSFWKDGSDGDGKSIENGNRFMILMNGSTYQDINIGSGYSQCNVNYREAHHPNATGKITIEYAGKSQSNNFTNVFSYNPNGEGTLSDFKTLTGPTVSSSFSTVRIRLDGTGNDTVGYGKVDDISLTCQQNVLPQTLSCPAEYTKITSSSSKMYVGGTTLMDITSKFSDIDKPVNIVFGDALTSDEYMNRENTKGQYHESVKVVFTDSNGNAITQTKYTDDLKDGVVYADTLTNLGTVTLPDGAKGVKLVHYGDSEYGTGDKSSPNSIDFKGLCYKAVEIADPNPEPKDSGKCYAMTDNESKVYELYMKPNANPLPTPRTISISKKFKGEGSAYRASNKTLYAFQVVGDDTGPSDLYSIDLESGATTEVVNDLISGSTDAAEFYHNPVTDKEILYVISGETGSKLYAFYADSWSAVSGYPKNIFGDSKNLSSLAIDPTTGNAYAVDDYNYDKIKPKIYKIDLLTGQTTFIVQTKQIVDAEGLAYAADGNLYLEDETQYNGRKIYKVDLQTGELIPAASFENTTGDWESIACDGTQMIIDYPTITIGDINDQTHLEGDSGTKEFVFTVSLSKPAVEDVTFTYVLEGQTATKGEDFIDKTATLTIPKGSTETTIPVEIKGDVNVESDETFIVKLQDVTKAVVKKGEGVGSIINDDTYIKIGDTVWLDSNHNGIQDEVHLLGVQDITVKLLDGSNKLLTTTKTNSAGYYEFNQLLAGEYYLDFSLPSGYTLSGHSQGADDCKDSDVHDGGKTEKIGLVSGKDDLCWDMGIYVTPNPKLEIEKSTNGEDADIGTGPSIAFGADVTWTYVVKNVGNVELSDIVVSDDKIGTICSAATLEVGESKTCTKRGKAVEGQYANVGKVRGKYATQSVEATDSSHYLGGAAPVIKVDIETATNGVDADTPTGPIIAYDGDVIWTYVVKNTGNVALTDVEVTDSKVGTICTVATLAVGASKTCTKTAKAVTGQYENIGKVVAYYGTYSVDDTDPTHYIGGEEPVVVPPVAVDDTKSGESGKAVTLDTLANDSGVDSNLNPTTVIFTANSAKTSVVPNEGTWSVNPSTGAITFTPKVGFTADPTAVGYTVEDLNGNLSNEAFEYVDYPQTVPVAKDDTKTGERCKAVGLNVLENDSDPEDDLNGSSVNFIVPTDAMGTDSDNDGDIDTLVINGEGRWRVDTDGNVTYTPSAECTGSPAPIKYTVSDLTGKVSNEATITVVYPDALKAELGNFVWFDADKNGQQNSGEPGVEGVTVELYNANAQLNATTTTDSNGSYSFINLEAGEYSVKFVAKEGWSITLQNASAVEESLDSDADKVTGKTELITLNEGDKNVDVDAGMYHTPQPSIKIVKTTNGGNVANIVVGDTVTWSYVVSNTGNAVLSNIVIMDNKEGAVSDCIGEGSLDLLLPTKSITCTKVGTAILGAYENKARVEAVDPESNKVQSEDSSSYIGKTAPVEMGSVGDYVWLEKTSSKDGIQGDDELPLSGIIIKLFDANNTEVGSTTTNASGKYLFTEVLAGSYHVEFTVPNGYTVTQKDQGDDAKDSDADANGKTETFTVAVGQDVTDIDMGLYPTVVKLGNRVWYDANRNGIQDTEEKDKNIADVVVKLYTESGEFVAQTQTRASGYYEFKDLVAGNYYVVFGIPSNYKVSPQNEGTNDSLDSDANPTTGKTDMITLVAGLDNRTVDMGLYQEAAKIGDRVWYDANKNGIQDQGENGVGDVDVKLYRVGENDPVAETKTATTGIYLFDNVIPGEYYVEFTAPAAYTITEANKGADTATDSNADANGRTDNFTLVSGTQNSSIDMGVYQNMVSFGDRVWLDTNHDGLQNIGEKGVRDVNVTIYSATSDFSKSVLTDENGNYLFTHLPAGEYSAEFRDVPYGYLITQQDVNSNESDLNDSDVFVNAQEKLVTEVTLLTPGKNDLSWDMGIYKTVCMPGKAVLGNLVWEDYNKNGIQDIGERGVANVNVTLYNYDTDSKVMSTTTDSNGLYEFAHIDPNFNYYVQFTVPAGYVVSPQAQDDDVIDSDADETGKTDVITLTADQIDSTVDMGIHHEGSTLGDRVWYDEKDGASNGIQEVEEYGVHDVLVVLYNASGNEVNSTRTNASGEYHFTNVPKGKYTIGFSNIPDGYVFTTADQGSDEARDSDVNSNGRTATITVNGVSNITDIDAGVKKVRTGDANNDIKRGITGQNVTIDVLANDTEGTYNFDASTVKITSTPNGATLSDDGKTLTVPGEGVWSVDPTTGAITFTPKDGFVGDPTAITYSVQDTEGNEQGAEVEVNYPPVANDDHVNGEVAKPIVIHVTDNDTNTSSPLDKASVRIIDPSNGDEVETLSVNAQGTWSTNADGSITFIPDGGFENNPTAIEYTVKEQSGDVSNRATVTIAYPDAVDDVLIISAGHTGDMTVPVSQNDSNNTDATTVTIGCGGAGTQTLMVRGEGTWNVTDTGSIIFTPESGFLAEPTDIKYTIGLVLGERSNCANVDIRYALLARDDITTMNVGGTTLIPVLSNDYGSLNPESIILFVPNNAPEGTTVSSDGKTLTVPGEGVWSVDTQGVVKFNAENGFTMVPTPIEYTVDDNEGTQSNRATITLTQGCVRIIAEDNIGEADGSNPIVIDVLNNDQCDLNGSTVYLIGPDGNLTHTILVDGGQWRVNDNGSVTFTPATGYTGTPTPINYVVGNRTGVLSNTATVSIIGTCTCDPYETSIPAMGEIAALVMVLLTLLVSMLLFRNEEKLFD
ncbi:carboxypeptidase regulatory-like domain-containing protein [bacterium]|nr:carboxypeptidase regulatory-like domain-containing protein [bacterium]MBU1957238.1 carboxypeptidase regulatory-like domain-containing protein [bacterium]